MNPVIETGAIVGAAIVVAVAMLVVPTPRQKPPEIDNPPPVEIPAPPPQVVVAPPPASISQQKDTTEKARLESIEVRLLHIQQQVQQMEKKVE